MLGPISLFVTCIRFSSTVQCRLSSCFDEQTCSVLWCTTQCPHSSVGGWYMRVCWSQDGGWWLSQAGALLSKEEETTAMDWMPQTLSSPQTLGCKLLLLQMHFVALQLWRAQLSRHWRGAASSSTAFHVSSAATNTLVFFQLPRSLYRCTPVQCIVQLYHSRYLWMQVFA